jgi:hypothetical protein
MRKGLNSKNFKHWYKDVGLDFHGITERDAEIFAKQVCMEQEIEKLRSRIIKLEKKIKK